MQNRRKVNLPKEYNAKHWNCLFKNISPEGEKSQKGQCCHSNRFWSTEFFIWLLKRKYKKFIVSNKSLHKKKKKASRSITVNKVVKKNFLQTQPLRKKLV